jgi:hypothetical protein
MDFLDKMYRLSQRRSAGLMLPAGYPFPVRPFKATLKDMALIAEVKYATPKDGLLGITDDPATIHAITSGLARAPFRVSPSRSILQDVSNTSASSAQAVLCRS